ncbi:MAG: hypothetical protein V2A61_04635 [Calditrichota bacterium]
MMLMLMVFDLAGREVKTLAEGWLEAGEYRAIWNAEAASSGCYIVKAQAGNRTFSRTLLHIR